MRIIFSDDHMKKILSSYIASLKMFGTKPSEVEVEKVHQDYTNDIVVEFTCSTSAAQVEEKS